MRPETPSTVFVFTFRYDCPASPARVIDLQRIADPSQNICPVFTLTVTYPPVFETYSIPIAVEYPQYARR